MKTADGPRRRVTLILAGLTLAILTTLVVLLPVPFSTMSPGPIIDTLGEIEGEPLLEVVDDTPTYPTEGSLSFTTVSVSRAQTRMTLPTAFRAWLDPNVSVVPHDFLYETGQTNEEASEVSAAQLSSSQDAARAVALRAVGEEVTETPTIAMVLEDSPASDQLEVGDVLLAVDGYPVETGEDAAGFIGDRTPGDSVEITVDRDGEQVTVELETAASDADSDRPMIGISIESQFEFGVDVVNNIDDRVGGPSAGMMFALGIYDILTPGPLTGGLEVAGTGSLSPSGEIGAIGGVRQKLAGAQSAGAEVFLVPEGNCAEARGFDTEMVVVNVSTFDEALSAVAQLAEDIDARVPTC